MVNSIKLLRSWFHRTLWNKAILGLEADIAGLQQEDMLGVIQTPFGIDRYQYFFKTSYMRLGEGFALVNSSPLRHEASPELEASVINCYEARAEILHI